MRRALAAPSTVLLALAAHAAPGAVSSVDGAWRLRADSAGLTLFDASGVPVRRHAAAAVAGIFDAAPRRSFIVLFETVPELWEISYDPQAEPIYPGLVHDYRQREGVAEPGFLNPRRTRLDAPLRALGFDSSHAFVIGRAPDRADGQAVVHVLQLDVRKRIAEFSARGDPDTAAVRSVWRDGREVLEVPDREGGSPLVIDARAARVLPSQPP